MGAGSFETSPYQSYDVSLGALGYGFGIALLFTFPDREIVECKLGAFRVLYLQNCPRDPSIHKKKPTLGPFGPKACGYDLHYIGLFGSLQGCKARDVKLRAEGISGPGLSEPSVCWSLKLGVKELNMSCHNVETMLITFQYFTHW